MMGRLALLGVGYVLGARAGRERYETIASAASRLATKLDNFSQGRPPFRSTSPDAARTPSPEG